MATVRVDGFEELTKKITQLADAGDAIGKMAVYDGAKVIADEIRQRIKGLPVEEDRFLIGDDKFDVMTAEDKKDLANALGISKIVRGAEDVRTVVGFAGYGSKKTKKYPNGLPMPLLARAIESGSSVREKHPFIRKAVNAKRKEVVRVMTETAERQINRTMEGRG
jgi:HK97 gp10 family phage protein